MSIPWKSLKKAHDILVGKADGFFKAGVKVPHVLFLIRVDTESGAITKCEILDQGNAAYVLSDKPLMVSRIRELLNEDADLCRRVSKTIGFLPNTVLQYSEVFYTMDEDATRDSPPPVQHPNRKSGLFVCVHTAAESFPTLHPIVDQPTRHCEFKEFPAQSCELGVFLAKAAL